MMKIRTTITLTEKADQWVTLQAEDQGISKNSVIQILINREMRINGISPKTNSHIRILKKEEPNGKK